MSEPSVIGAPSGDNANPGQGGQGSGTVIPGQGDLPEREWVKDLPEPLKASKSLRKFADDSWKSDLAKSYVELEGHLGKSVTLPDTNAPPEEWEKFFSRVGRPVSTDEYESHADKLDPAFEASFKQKAFKAGLTKAQYADAIGTILGSNDAAKAAYKAQADRESADTAKKLREEYGVEYDTKMAQANTAIGALFSDTVKERLASAGLMRDPAFLKSMAAYGERFGETQFIKGSPAPSVKQPDPYDWMKERFGKQ
jgi:hypothetical protein